MSSPPLHVLVIAHPDDESMFFVPTLVSLERVWIVCLSNGNFDGLGATRKEELQRACSLLRIERVWCLDAFPDDPHRRWDASEVAQVLETTLQPLLQREQADVHVLTFDKRGVSGHFNHVDTYRGVQYWLRNRTKLTNIASARTLVTISNPLIKYIPLCWLAWIVLWKSRNRTSSSSCLYTLCKPWIVWKCMALHQSQFVWYRRLSVLFSVYTYYNAWKDIVGDDSCQEKKRN